MNDQITTARGEFTHDGKLYHRTGAMDGPNVVAHEGAWLNCDGCNPVVVVDAFLFPKQETATLLEQLRIEYGRAKQAEREAKERAATATSKLKAALNEASGGALRSSLHVPGFKPVNLTYSEPWQFDMETFKDEQPATYVQYAHKKPGGQWTLAESRGRS